MTGSNNKMDIEKPVKKVPETKETEKKTRNPIQGNFLALKKVILYDLDLLESSRNAKDNKIGTRIVRDIKFLRRNITMGTLRKFWDLVASD